MAQFLEMRLGPHNETPSPRRVGPPNGVTGFALALELAIAVRESAGGEIRSVDKPRQFVERYFLLLHHAINEILKSITNLCQVVRRHARRHAYGYTGSAIHQQVGQSGRKDQGFSQARVEVVAEVHRVLVNVLQNGLCQLSQTGLGIAHGSSAVAINRTEVPLSIHQQIPR